MEFPSIDPVFMRLGPIQLRWYGLMYVISFIITYLILKNEAVRKKLPLNGEDISDLLFYGILGVVLGGRIGYILFYNLGFYLQHPLKILAVWEGGMSFHGGFIGVIAAFWIYARSREISFWTIIDIAAQCAPVGLGLGRIGNFINGELYGRATDLPWGIVFPGTNGVPRHPSQLYEAFLEGFLLFFIVRFAARHSETTGVSGWTFVTGYGLFRFIVEFFRQPDVQMGIYLGYFSMGQILSFPMFIAGLFMICRICLREQKYEALK